MKTYNQIRNIFQDIATSNPFIKGYGSGMIEDVNTLNTKTYPILWIVPQNVMFKEQTMEYKIRVLVLDKDEKDDTYREDILSDTLSIMGDVIKVFRNDSSFQTDILGNSVAQPVVQAFGDYVSGWYSDLTIECDYFINNDCDIPV